MHVLVTGGGGFLGRYIVEQLLDRGDAVRVFSRGEYPELEKLGAEVRRGDLRDADAVDQACRGCQAVFHVAAIPGIWGPWKTYFEINTQGTEHVIRACHRQGVEKLIHTSSPSVVFDGHPHIDADESLPYPERYSAHYPRSKALAERQVLEANGREGLLTVSLRPHLIWGPRDNHLIPRLIDRALAGRLVRVGRGENVVSMSYVENVAQAHLRACDALAGGSPCAGQAYFINEPQPVRLWNWIDDFLALGGLPPVRRAVAPRVAWTAGALLEAAYALLRLKGEPPMTRFLALQLSQSHSYSIGKAQRDFGYEPRVSAEEGMERLRPEIEVLVSRRRA
jgi:2-alkyl-3-oxoalkanoate reductase